MIIHVDVDGVLADFIGAVCRELRARGFDRSPEEVLHWDLKATFSAEETRHVYDAMSTPGFCHGLEWYDGARDFVREVSREGTVHALTAPYLGSETWMRERLAWLRDAVPSERVMFVSGKHKHLVRGDALIEDHPKTAREWCEAHPDGIAILIDRPWNRPGAAEFWPHSRMFRVKSYEEALQVLRECA